MKLVAVIDLAGLKSLLINTSHFLEEAFAAVVGQNFGLRKSAHFF